MAHNYKQRSNTAAPFPPYIPCDGFMFTDECKKYCNR